MYSAECNILLLVLYVHIISMCLTVKVEKQVRNFWWRYNALVVSYNSKQAKIHGWRCCWMLHKKSLLYHSSLSLAPL